VKLQGKKHDQSNKDDNDKTSDKEMPDEPPKGS